eukprot:TRINITY_DN10871_c0_g1_i1.p1 TRINITY_DN10871_c0_g1~~TRINITY_DN10871_c0_g1_i1.p1  ORF type:complete len:320 (-),score=59.64 TRINITY_DN10871_c0_g1_i1:100-1059(-)
MERYKKFEDKGTGIVPFLPKTLRFSPMLIVIFALRLPFLALFFALHAVFSALFWAIIPFSGVRRIFYRFTDSFFLGGVLFTLGAIPFSALFSAFFCRAPPNLCKIADPIRVVKSKKRAEFEEISGDPSRRVGPKSAIFAAPLGGPLEILGLAMRHSPVFAILGDGKDHDGACATVSFYTALFHYSGLSPYTGPYLTTVSESISENSAPIAVFPEKTTGNGRGLLEFDSIPTGDAPIRLISVRSSAAFPLGMAAKSWLFLAGSAENSLEFRYFRPEDIEIAGIDPFRTAISKDLLMAKLEKNASDKAAFSKYFAENSLEK